MRILSYNILSGGFRDYQENSKIPERLDKIIQAVKQSRANLVSLIDTYRWQDKYSPKEISEWFGYKYIYMTALDDDRVRNEPHGMTVMTNIKGAKFETIKIHSRKIIKTTINKLEIFSVYLDTYEEEIRLKQLDALYRQINQNLSTILIGDFNAIDINEVDKAKKVIVKLFAQFPQLEKISYIRDMLKGTTIETIKSWGFKDADKRGVFTVPSKLSPIPLLNPVFRIDYAFVHPEIKVRKFEVLKGKVYDYTSDHYPIVVDIDF